MSPSYRGKFPDAISSIEQALAALTAEASLPWLLPARHLLARAYAALGRVDEAERVLADAQEHTGRYMALHTPHGDGRQIVGRRDEGFGAPRGRIGPRRRGCRTPVGQLRCRSRGAAPRGRFGDRTVAERLEALVERSGTTSWHSTRATPQRSPPLTGGSRCGELGIRRAGSLLSAADSAAQAAPLHDRAGQRRQSVDSAARALQLATVCGGAVTPAIKAAAQPLPVSAREREIALLVAAGLSNQEIAERLTVSVRTVEGHVYRACFKLDVADRDELAKLMRHELAW